LPTTGKDRNQKKNPPKEKGVQGGDPEEKSEGGQSDDEHRVQNGRSGEKDHVQGGGVDKTLFMERRKNRGKTAKKLGREGKKKEKKKTA